MRTLSETLTAAQKAAGAVPIVKIVLTQGENSYTYTKTRILVINHHEEPYTQKATVWLDNADKTLSALDFIGYQGVLSYGFATTEGDEYSDCAPLWVVPHQSESSRGRLVTRLDLIGILDLMAEDRASESYNPTTDDTKTVKDLIREIAGDSGVTQLSVFNHCTAYDIEFDSEDSLIDVYMPKDSFKIYTNGSRLAAIRRLLDYTKCVMRAESDGKLHISEPTTTGAVYDYEYKLLTAGEHTFFSKAYRTQLVIPNYIVCKSNTDDYPQYSGYASDAASYALIPKRQYVTTRLASNAQANAIATAVLSKYQLHSKLGAADVPMNVGAEVFDYVKITDSRENDNRIGNLGELTRHWNANKKEFRMTFSFGGWLSIRGLASDLQVYPDGINQNIKNMIIENLYAQYIYAEMVDVEYLSAISAQMGLLTAGEIRIGTGVLDPTGTATSGSQTTLVDSAASWTPDEWIGEDIRVVIAGVAYTRAITDNDATSITFEALPEGVEVAADVSYYLGVLSVAAGDQYFIKSLGLQTATGGSSTTLTDTGEGWTVNEHAGKALYIIKNGLRYERTITSNTADTLTFPTLPDYEPFNGFRIWTEDSIGRMAGYKEGVIQYYTGSDGYLYAGGGKVVINADGITIDTDDGTITIDNEGITIEGEGLRLKYGSNFGFLSGLDGGHILLSPYTNGSVFFDIDEDGVVGPVANNKANLGSLTAQYRKAFLAHRLKIPVGVDMYD